MTDFMRTGGKLLVDQLILNGVDKIFCVPGESYLAILDALRDCREKIRVVNARHESGAANMAESYGKMTGSPGLALVTRGPGACHASVGVHIAQQDSSPLILLVGQVPQSMIDREAFQEIDYKSMFSRIAKWSAQIEKAERIPEYISRAFKVAVSGRPGPVVLSLPEDILTQSVNTADAKRYTKIEASAGEKDLNKFKNLLSSAEKPLIILGGSDWNELSSSNIADFAEKHHIPVATSFRRQDSIDNNSDVFVGSFGTSVSPSLLRGFQKSDLLVVLGARLGEMTTNNYKSVNVPIPKQRLIHVYPDSSEIGSVYSPDLGLVSSMNNISTELKNIVPAAQQKWFEWCSNLRNEYLKDLEPKLDDKKLNLAMVFRLLDKELSSDAIITLDAGNHNGWPQRFLQYSPIKRQIGSTCGSMGYAIPAAVSASLIYPKRTVVGCVGDGGFMMSGLELMTAVQHNGKPIIIVFNNFSYGTIRMHQEREYPNRVMATDLDNPNFIKLAESMGAYAERVEKTSDFIPAFRRCLSSGKPSVIELLNDLNQITTRTTIQELKK